MFKYLIAAFWSALFGEIVGYLVSQMTSVSYNPTAIAIVSIILGEIALIAIPALSGMATPKESTEK
ncbi:YjzD family protein [Eupransor demetentiae]|uniref:DUF2929 domain-containing protein n=1 Tax=Eupransor demetentiae TaxID=3109584 RepID=A0ABP0ENL3_9LACO|nr:hypothetical protein R54876_GBNLAHCA_00413 [Lactobacillaceae bacterium LMG 33000]